MSAGYIIARENFKEAEKHVSADADPVMFNLLFGLQSLTNQIEADFAFLRAGLPTLRIKKKPKLVEKARQKKGSKKAKRAR